MKNLNETSVNIISEGTRIEGKVVFDQVSRFHGMLIGEAHAREGSTLVLTESSFVEGDIFADTLWIDGFVQGNVHARTRVVVSGTGRVIGNIQSPSLKLEFGAYFEGTCNMEQKPQHSAPSPSGSGGASFRPQEASTSTV
jgi:cytoskeletal protein CcmA (bactofilin family)